MSTPTGINFFSILFNIALTLALPPGGPPSWATDKSAAPKGPKQPKLR